jgi:hypothetical protein
MRISLLTVVAGLSVSLACSAQAAVEWADWSAGPETGVIPGSFPVSSTTVTYSGSNSFKYVNTNSTTYLGYPVYSVPGINGPTYDSFIALADASPHTLSFSAAVTNPVMAIISLGQPGFLSTWTFDKPFSIVSVGQGAFGNGGLTNPVGNLLIGTEGHGLIQFQGTFSSVSWTVTSGEFWAGFNIGIIPAPSAGVMLGLAGLAAARRRR